ncbi:MAG: Rieske (2Fe-2S) protein [Acidimicrobiia bacterium]|nr:Rieske (2Fe-2S) protein [Acidimicrobiia bacterium]
MPRAGPPVDLHRLAERLGRIEALDRPAKLLAELVKAIAPPTSLPKDLLSGTWLGHPLHPLLTDIPIGSFTSATVLDLIGGPAGERAADRLVHLGLLSSVATAAAGAADWSDTDREEQRVGVVHAAANVAGVALYGLSALARRRGRRRAATTYGLAGMAVMTVGGYLGGFLGYGRGVGVNKTFSERPPTAWTPVLDDAELPTGEPHRVDVGGATVLLYRRGQDILAIGSRCSHAGGPLEEGDVDTEGRTVTCPWHRSVFDLTTGEVVHGPASVPQPAYDTRVQGGRVEVRARV